MPMRMPKVWLYSMTKSMTMLWIWLWVCSMTLYYDDVYEYGYEYEYAYEHAYVVWLWVWRAELSTDRKKYYRISPSVSLSICQRKDARKENRLSEQNHIWFNGYSLLIKGSALILNIRSPRSYSIPFTEACEYI